MIPIWKGKISKGKLQLEDRRGLDDYIQTRPDGDYQLILRPKQDEEKSPTQQYRYLWGVIYQHGSESLGYTKEELHEEMKKIFIPIQRKNRETGETETVGGTTTGMSIKERSEFIDKVRRQLAEMGVNTPDVSEVYF